MVELPVLVPEQVLRTNLVGYPHLPRSAENATTLSSPTGSPRSPWTVPVIVVARRVRRIWMPVRRSPGLKVVAGVSDVGSLVGLLILKIPAPQERHPDTEGLTLRRDRLISKVMSGGFTPTDALNEGRRPHLCPPP